jgi:beta-lactamase regulating signal transducer with metallopeptidase domain
MANKVVTFLTYYSFNIMIAGFLITAPAITMYIMNKDVSSPTRTIWFIVTIAGLCVYVVGRVFIFIQRRQQRKAAAASENRSKDLL